MTAGRRHIGLRATLVFLAATVLATACTHRATDAGSSGRKYIFGDLSPEEQQLWWLTNRARADPAQEGRWLVATGDALIDGAIDAFQVDRRTVVSDFASYPARPPVAWNEKLAAAARTHALDQAKTHRQSHLGTDGSLPGERVRAAGLTPKGLLEVVNGYAHSPLYAHAAFQVDWGGPPPSGVQGWPQPGHRMAIMSARAGRPAATAVGLAWVPVPEKRDDAFGPYVVVGEYAALPESFLVGTVWRDGNGNGTYDLGEGVGGAEVRPSQGSWYAVTAPGGGFQIPLDDIDTNSRLTVRVLRNGDEVARRDIPVRSVGANVLVDIALS